MQEAVRLGAPTLGRFHRNLRMRAIRTLTLVVVGFTMPIEYVTLFTVAGFDMTPNKAVTGVLFVLAVLNWVFAGRRLPRNSKNGWVLLFAFSFAVATMASLAKGTPPGALVVLSTTNVSIFLLYFLIPLVVVERRDLRIVLWSIGAGTILTVGTAFAGVGHVTGKATMLRLGGLGGAVNLFGFNLAATIPLLFMLSFTTRSRFGKLFGLGVALLALAGLIFTLSRSAYVATAVMAVVCAARLGRLDVIKYVIPIAGALAAAVLLAPSQFEERVSTMTSAEGRAEDGSIQKRLVVNGYALRAFASNPVTGLGIARFGPWASARNSMIKPANVVHSSYLSVAAEQGLLGLVPYLVILGIAYRDFSRVWRVSRQRGAAADPDLRALGLEAVFLQVALVGSLVINVFQPSLTYKMGWLLIASSTTVLQWARERVEIIEGQGASATEEHHVVESPWLQRSREGSPSR